MAVGVLRLFLWCSFVLVEVPDITGIPAFTQNSTYGYYPVWSHLFVPRLISHCPDQSHSLRIFLYGHCMLHDYVLAWSCWPSME